MLGEVVEARHVVDVRADVADSLEFLAVLILVKIRQRVAAEQGARREDVAAFDTRIVPLVGGDSVGSGDRTQLEVRPHIPFHGECSAARLVNAFLLHGAEADRLAIRADMDQRRERVDRARRRGGRCCRTRRRRARERADRANGLAVDVVVQQLAVERGVLILGVVDREIGAKRVDRFPQALQAGAGAVILVPSSLTGERVLGGRVLMLDDAVELERQAGDLVEVLVDLGVIRAVIADAGDDAATEDARGGFRDDGESAALGVAAEQRALRSAQHFDALNVEQRSVEALRAAHVDAVDVGANARVAGGLVLVERHDAAHADRQRRLARFEGRDTQAGDDAVRQVEQRLDVIVLDQLRVDDRDRDRRVLQVGVALQRGDNHHIASGVVIGRCFVG